MSSSRPIAVTLLSASTGETLISGDIPAEMLPASFSLATTLNLGGPTLVVERAEPPERSDYERLGSLRLWVREARSGEFVRLTLIDAQTGNELESSDVAVDELPEALVEGAATQVAGVDYSVVRADPPTREGWASTGQLTVYLVARGDPVHPRPGQTLWLAVPTIASDMAPMDGGPITGQEYVLDEDEWRQIELVSASCCDQIDAELERVRTVLSNARGEHGGYSTSHVREGIASPLDNRGLQREAIIDLLRRHDAGDAHPIADMGLRIRESTTRVRGGFALHLSGAWVLYGFEDDGRVRALGFDCRTAAPLVSEFESTLDWLRARAVDEMSGRFGLAGHFVAAVRDLARQHDLVLVDWCRGVRLSPDDDALAHAFGDASAQS